MRIGERIEVTFETLALGGEALGHTAEGLVVFASGVVPGDRGLVEITKRKPRFAVGALVELREPSSLRVPPRCEYFGRCGGCKWQYLTYADQLRFKQQQVTETLAHLGKLQDFAVNPILGTATPWYYRNKMEFSFGQLEQEGVLLGQHENGRWDRLVDLETCYLQSERSVAVFSFCRTFARQHKLTAFTSTTEQGLLRHVVVREGKQTGDLMVNLVISGEPFVEQAQFVQELCAAFPDLTSLILTINRNKGQSSQGQEEQVLFGQSTITEKVNQLLFEISAKSFFQTNTLQTEHLYQIVQRMVQGNLSGTAVDLYCGTGAIAFHLAPLFQQVHGIELVAEAVENARRNAARNNLANITFHCGEVQKLFPSVIPAAPDVIVVDPPRAGLSKKAIKHIMQVVPRQIVYVSCNPATLARDVALLLEGGYQVVEVQPVDMFPHTYHIETVMDLRKIC
jgi:23S rRNA (uracil1939-C5)-methyltransferase